MSIKVIVVTSGYMQGKPGNGNQGRDKLLQEQQLARSGAAGQSMVLKQVIAHMGRFCCSAMYRSGQAL